VVIFWQDKIKVTLLTEIRYHVNLTEGKEQLALANTEG
jgi:hypothetical protein